MEPLNQIRVKPVSVGARSPVEQSQAKAEVSNASSVVSAPITSSVSTTKANGITQTLTPEGFKLRQSDSGLSSLASENGQQVTLPDGKAFIVNGQEVRWLQGGQDAEPKLVVSQDGKVLVAYQDQDQSTVQVDPDSLVYEVLNKAKNLSQVHYPDNFQEVVAFGQYRSEGRLESYENHVLFDANGREVGSEGFDKLSFKGNKLSFELPGGVKVERTLLRALPGQTDLDTASAQAPDAEVPSTGASDFPLEVKALVQPTPPEFEGLTDISKDFFAEADKPGISFDETPSHLVMRQEGHTRAFLLPNGDAFRTDGKHLQVLGENPRARNARMVVENEQQYLAYSDPEGNNHKLEVNSGDYEVSNRQGSLTQGLLADGTRQYGVRGTYTSQAGTPEQYFFKASFSEDGKLLSNHGFDDFRVSGDKLSFTLPNGVASDRHLITASETDLSIAKKLVLTGGVAQEWGDDLALAEELLSGGYSKGGQASPSPGVGGVTPLDPAAGIAKPSEPIASAPGLVRQPLPDGSGSVSILPNGIRIIDGEEVYATDAQGNRLEVVKNFMPLPVEPIISDPAAPAETEEPALPADPGLDPTNYLLSVSAPDGVQYTISNQNLDLIVQSRDGKIHQLVSSDGSVLTSIVDYDNGFKHMYQSRPYGSGSPYGTPGTRWDPNQPDRLFIDGSPVGSYQLPFAIPTLAPPQAGPSPSSAAQMPQVAQGFSPQAWQSFGPAFTGVPTNPQSQPSPAGYNFGANILPQEPYAGAFGPWPGSYTNSAPQPYLPVGTGLQGAPYPNEGMGSVMATINMMGQMARMNMMFYACPFGFF